jgi:hypothetical protein
MYLQILNIVLILILIGLLVWLGWNIYQSSQPIVKYEVPEFPEGFEKERQIEFPERLDSNIDLKFAFTNPDLVNLRITSVKHFKIDWGNGLEVPYTGSIFPQKLPPIGYGVGNFTLKITSEPESVTLLDIQMNNKDGLESVTFTNTSIPVDLFPKWDLSKVTIIHT